MQFVASMTVREWDKETLSFKWLFPSHAEGGGKPKGLYKKPHLQHQLLSDCGLCTTVVPWADDHCPGTFGGLRNHSEMLSLRLADLDWGHGAMTVISPKTEGHGQGVVPMFARLRHPSPDASS